MLSVFICDDDAAYRKRLCRWVEGCIEDENLDMRMEICTSNPRDIIKIISTNKVNGMYFLDVELEGGYNGVKAANTVRQYDPRGFIVFITAYPDYLGLTFEYKVEALEYIHKTRSDVKGKVYECIRDAYNKYVSRSDEGRYILKTHSGQTVSCGYDEILFFETDAPGTKRIILHTHKRMYTFYGSIDEIAKRLPVGQFYKCHKSCIVNVKHLSINCIDDLIAKKSQIIMPNGLECPVSTRKRFGLQKLLLTSAP
ncbi:MAG: LytTR family DNA-binding domain-containing protein [Defluviitaleaceae bacterium]|nr:LytTR family DNA-binding domain-containing protein [Defluviitaleaceae bacterium]